MVALSLVADVRSMVPVLVKLFGPTMVYVALFSVLPLASCSAEVS